MYLHGCVAFWTKLIVIKLCDLLIKASLRSILYLLFFVCYVSAVFTMSVTSVSKLFTFEEIH